MTRRLLLAIVLLACARTVSAQIAFDNCTDAGSTTATSQTFSHTITGTNPILFVGVTADLSSDLLSTDNVTYNGVAGTRVSMAGADVSGRRLYLYLWLAPATGAHNVVITPTASSFLWGQAVSYTGAIQAGSYDAKVLPTGSASATSFDTTWSTVTDNSWRLLAARDPQGVSAGTGSTARCGSGSSRLFDSNGVVHPAGSGTMTVTGTPADMMYTIGVSFAPFSATGASRLTLLGVGQ